MVFAAAGRLQLSAGPLARFRHDSPAVCLIIVTHQNGDGNTSTVQLPGEACFATGPRIRTLANPLPRA